MSSLSVPGGDQGSRSRTATPVRQVTPGPTPSRLHQLPVSIGRRHAAYYLAFLTSRSPPGAGRSRCPRARRAEWDTRRTRPSSPRSHTPSGQSRCCEPARAPGQSGRWHRPTPRRPARRASLPYRNRLQSCRRTAARWPQSPPGRWGRCKYTSDSQRSMAPAEAPAVLVLDAIQQVILVDAGIDGDVDAVVAQICADKLRSAGRRSVNLRLAGPHRCSCGPYRCL